MEEHGIDSIPGLIRSLLDDTRELIREEMALARAEIRDDIAAARTVAVSFAGAAVAGFAGAMLLAVAIGGGIAYAAGWPSWVGYGIVAVLLLIVGGAAAAYGRAQIARLRAMPKTTQTVKENMSWMQNKSGAR